MLAFAAILSLPLLALTTANAAPARPTSAYAAQSGTPPMFAKRLTGVQIKAGKGDNCLQPIDPEYCPEEGVEVTTVPCAEAVYTWDINRGSGSVTVHGYPDLALDAGMEPQNGGEVKLWTSYPGLYQQTWYYTDDNRIAITGGDQCLDLTDGEAGAQTWQCTYMNPNQVWETN